MTNHQNSAPSTLHTVKEALELIIKEANNFSFEEINLEDAYGRVLYENIYADRNYPPFNRAAVDGFAIRSEDLLNHKEFTIIEEVYAGSLASKTVIEKTAIKIMTGAPVPTGADAVIKVEDSEIKNNTVSFLVKEIKSRNVAPEGEDTKKGETVIHKSQVCTPLVLGTLAALGKAKVKVYKLPVIAIISTGDEIKSVGEEILPYQIRDSNAYSLLGFFQHYNIIPQYRKIVADDKNILKEEIEKVLHADILILSGGVSMGDADFVPEVLTELGIKKIFHKIAVKPGKPLWFGTKEQCAVFALPGNPFSVQVAFKIFIEPYLRKCFGAGSLKSIELPLQTNKKKKTNFDEYFPCQFLNNPAASLDITSFHGSGDVCSIVNSDGIALHPAEEGDLSEGAYVDFFPWKNL
jgi:molybdopterin molybdotransferase